MSLREILKQKIDLEKKYKKAKKLSTQIKISEEIKRLNRLIDKEFGVC